MATPVPPITSWDELGDDFTRPDILLGNGFSIGVDTRFRYASLFQSFLDALDNEADRMRIESLESKNFEYLLESLSRAAWINERFDIPDDPLDEAAALIRTGLIEAVERVHPRYGELDEAVLGRLCDQLGPFEDIYTTNYDALLYHIIMIAKDRYAIDQSLRPYNDYFWEARNADYLEFRDYQNYRHFRHIYYLHGALFLFSQPDADVKLRRGGGWTELIEIVAEHIQDGDIPLFVSEGSAEEKRAAIHRSEYLSFALEKLRKGGRSIVVYGFGFSQPDKHIADALNERGHPVAVAIRRVDKSEEELRRQRLRILHALAHCPVSFFPSSDLFQEEATTDAT